MTDVSIVRGPVEAPQIMRFDIKGAIRGDSTKGNPELEPGDIVFVPQAFVSNWRDGVQLLFTALSLNSLLQRQ